MSLFNQATKLRRELNDLIHGSTLEQRQQAARKLFKLDTTPQRHSRDYIGNVNLVESGYGVKAWLDEQLDQKLYYGASVILRQRGPKNDSEAKIEILSLQECIDALTAAGTTTTHDPVQDAFQAAGGSVSYI